MSPSRPESSYDNDDVRDFNAEFEAFLLEHQVEIRVVEVFHLSPMNEATEDIRQHNHVLIRSGVTKRNLSLCVTAMNWDNSPIVASQVIANLAAEVRLLAESDSDFVTWALTFEFDPDSRGVERKFRQTIKLAESLLALLGERAYDQLHELSFDAAEALGASGHDDYDLDEDED